MRIYRNVRMAKRGGRAHDVHGIKGTPEGGLALSCPACPRPGVNLDVNYWDLAKPEDR